MEAFLWLSLILALVGLQNNYSLFVFELVEVSFSHLK